MPFGSTYIYINNDYVFLCLYYVLCVLLLTNKMFDHINVRYIHRW